MTPEQEEQVRRALAAAGRTETHAESGSVPPDVAARLDHVLAELVQGRSQSAPAPAGPPAGQPDELAARRRRKWPNVLVAAAAVAVIAAAGGAVVTRGLGTSGADSGTSSASAGAGGSAQDRVQPGAGSAPSASGGAQFAAPGTVPRLRLRTATLDADVRRAAAALRSPAKNAEGSGGGSARATACATPAVPRGADVVDVRLDGRRATLVLDPPAHGARVARIYSCDDASSPVATRTVRQP
ncbi:hypothetical protein KRR39_20155 [Nocardioides panacis]|uniref:Uncharacterized protein n=1 Tax=Nocardioides panacis TaxID=2849501 RepID=A0A975XZQ8_9ACTN|nr:hypothetical protein [Nocardioides panacis]QWZ07687.1 hypothetical protein KRR39_20155 [Nocardioides panacis]